MSPAPSSPLVLGIVGMGSMGFDAARTAPRRGMTTWGLDTLIKFLAALAGDELPEGDT